MKITHLTSAHERFDIRIFSKECTSLSKINDFDVSLIVGDSKGDEIINNIKIYDVGKLSGRYNRMIKTTKKIFEKAIELNSDIYHFHDPELIPIGIKLKKMGKYVIFDVHENTDLQILERDWIPFFLRKTISTFFKVYEKQSSQKFDYLIVPQYAMYQKFLKINKTEVIGNFPTIHKLDDSYMKKNSKYNLLYSGSLTESRGLFNMLNLLSELILIDEKFKLTIAGNINEILLEKAKLHSSWKNVVYLGYLSQSDLQKVYKENSIGLIMFNNVGQYYMAYSLKLFEYMQNGLTVIMPDFGDWIHFNNENNVGYNINVLDTKTTAKIIFEMNLSQLDKNSIHNQNVVQDKFTWEKEEEKLIKLYRSIK